MSLQVSAVPTSPQKAYQSINRQSANYHPTIWGNHFLSCASDPVNIDAATQQEYEELKQEVRGMLISTTYQYSYKLSLIDAVQRLGVAYHFQKEVEDELEKLYQDDCRYTNDLNTAALRFRLLRQQGYNVPSDVFGKFKDENGKFKSSLVNDVTSMLSLYEAAHLGIRGEDVLDEAIDFTTSHLKSMVTQVSPHLAENITHALKWPLRKAIPRLATRHEIDFYLVDNPVNEKLLKFAKLDFNILQAQYRKELSSLTEWWNNLDFATRLPYARDRVVEVYFWSVGAYFEPQYTLGRRFVTKVAAMLSIIDDTYDIYGTLEELELLTDAINRWDISTIDTLPEYMKDIYQALLDVYSEIEMEMSKKGSSYRTDYAIQEMKRVVQGYMVEVKWCNQDYVATLEEYLKISLVTSAYKLLEIISFLDMGDIANKQVFEWISNDPKIVVASTFICRLMDDIATREWERKRKHVATAVDCYMKQHSISEEEAIRFLKNEISSAWKDTNQEFLKPTAVPIPFLEVILNFSRVADFMYKYEDDGYTFPFKVKDEIASVFANSIPF